ncbi:hypothetical protein BSKO_01443 [Bryopsis sp. KO-2023]|nr:hypothetical protein BSKO_01443 [Bryopsis sp. KO-2023]
MASGSTVKAPPHSQKETQHTESKSQEGASFERGALDWPPTIPTRTRSSRFRRRGSAWSDDTLKKLGIYHEHDTISYFKETHPRPALQAWLASAGLRSKAGRFSSEDGESSSVEPVGSALKTVHQQALEIRNMDTKKKRETKHTQVENASSTLPSEKKRTAPPSSGRSALANGSTKKRNNKYAKRMKKSNKSADVPAVVETTQRNGNDKNGGTPGSRKKCAGASQDNTQHLNGKEVSGTSTGKPSSPHKPLNGGVAEGNHSRAPQAHTSKVSDESTGEQQQDIQPSFCKGSGNVLGASNGCAMNGRNALMVTGQGTQGNSPGPKEEQGGGAGMPPSASEHPDRQSNPSSSLAATKSQNGNTEDERNRKKKRAGGELGCSMREGVEQECAPATNPATDHQNPKASPLQGNGNCIGATPNTVSDIQQGAAANGNHVRSNPVAACENTPPRVSLPAAPSAAECESKDKKTVVNGTTVRRIPQGDGLGPLKPWPSFDYGMSGEEYLTLFHQRNARLHALQGDNGLDASHPIEIDMDESMIQENPFMGMDWRQRDPMMFPGAYMGFFGMRPPMMPPMMMRGMEGMFDGMGMPMGLMNQRRREPEAARPDASQEREASTRIHRASSESREKHLEINMGEEESDDTLKATTTPKKKEDAPRTVSNAEPHTPTKKSQPPLGQQMMKPMFPVPPQPMAGFGAPFPGLPFPMMAQGANAMPNFLAGTGDAPSKQPGNPAVHSDRLAAGANVGPETPLAQPAVNPSTWVANLMGQVVAGVQDQNSGAAPKEGEAGGVVFFHGSSFKPVEPPWKSKLELDVEMEIDEVPFPDDPDFSMSCFDDLDGAGQGELEDDVVSYGDADRAESGLDIKDAATVVLSETEEPKATRGCGIRGRGRRCTGRGGGGRQGNRLCGQPPSWLGGSGNINHLQRNQRKKKIRAKGKDGKPRIYPRIPKVTSLVPACVNGGLQKLILEDLESHTKDYVDDNDTLDRLVQDIESYLALLQRFERSGQRTEWCEGCIEVILRGLQNSRVDPEEAKESGLIDSILKTTKHRNGGISRAARRVLKEEWAVQALQILETDQAAKHREEANRLPNVPLLHM